MDPKPKPIIKSISIPKLVRSPSNPSNPTSPNQVSPEEGAWVKSYSQSSIHKSTSKVSLGSRSSSGSSHLVKSSSRKQIFPTLPEENMASYNNEKLSESFEPNTPLPPESAGEPSYLPSESIIKPSFAPSELNNTLASLKNAPDINRPGLFYLKKAVSSEWSHSKQGSMSSLNKPNPPSRQISIETFEMEKPEVKDESGFKRRESMNYWSQFWYSYLNPMIHEGKKRKIPAEEYPSVESFDEASRLSQGMYRLWKAEVKINPKSPKLGIVLWQAFGASYCSIGLLFLLESFVKVAESYLLGYFLVWFETAHTDNTEGYLRALYFALSVFAQALLNQYKFFVATRVGMQVRIGLTSMIYQKAIELPISRVGSSGQLINMISSDVQRFEEAAAFSHYIWVGPIEVLLIFYFMYLEIGLSAISPIVVLLLLIPLQTFFGNLFTSIRKQTNKARDDRIKSVSDMIAGIIVVKMYAWEDAFTGKISSIRQKELSTVQKAASIRALNDAIFFASSAVISFFTFGTFYLLGGTLTPSNVFTCLTYLQTVRQTMANLFAKGFQFSTEAKVALRRIQDFMEIEGLEEIDAGSSPNKDHVNTVAGATTSFAVSPFGDSPHGSPSGPSVLTSLGNGPTPTPIPKMLIRGETMVSIKGANCSWKPPPVTAPANTKSTGALKTLAGSTHSINNIPLQKANATTDSLIGSSTKTAFSPPSTSPFSPLSPTSPSLNAAQALMYGKKNAKSMPQLNSTFATDVLHNINLEIHRGELVGVCGPVGSGKSSLLYAILGEIPCNSGSVTMTSKKIGYVSQSPWILAGTLRENILFGRRYREDWFKEVVKACAMERDFELLPDGENTFIGDRGFTLSGGQRARLSLARACYSNADIYLLDDPLSAVDPAVGKHLFEQCIKGILRKKARLLVTHLLHYVEKCDTVLLMESGAISQAGTFHRVASLTGSKFAEAMREFSSVNSMEVKNANILPDDDDSEEFDEAEDDIDAEMDALRQSLAKRKSYVRNEARPKDESARAKQFREEETSQGSIGFKTYLLYFLAGAGHSFVLVLLVLLLLAGQGAAIMSDWWLSHWVSEQPTDQSNKLNLIIFGALCGGTIVLSILRANAFSIICLNASRNIFNRMLQRVFRAPMFFFQNNPHGRIMNRFAKDVSLVDEMLPQTFFDFVQRTFMILGTIVIAGLTVPYVLVTIPFILIVFYLLRSNYIQLARQMKRLEATTRTPIFSHITTSLEGLPIIRAFQVQPRFLAEFNEHLNNNTKVYFTFTAAGRWLGLRLDMLAAVLLSGVSFAVIPLGPLIFLTPAAVGLLLSYLLQLIGTLQWAVRQSAEVENLMVSTERILEYSEIAQETDAIKSFRPDKEWPQKGDINIKNLTLTYPNQLSPVLSDLSIHIESGTKCGIVGRTGAGKSSFVQALFRLVEPKPEGCIVIDGLESTKMGLTDLRSRLAIIPQEPFCFKGTLRFNLDPFDTCSDEKLWNVLELIELKDTIMAMNNKLDAEVSENGSNWSVGERQLICLGRAILRGSKILFMDEATSSLDIRTDSLIQKIIGSDANGMIEGCTIITIAHRLNTIIDYDNILVLDGGKVVEFGPPWVLLEKDHEKPGSWFAKMVSETGKESEMLLKRLALARKRKIEIKTARKSRVFRSGDAERMLTNRLATKRNNGNNSSRSGTPSRQGTPNNDNIE